MQAFLDAIKDGRLYALPAGSKQDALTLLAQSVADAADMSGSAPLAQLVLQRESQSDTYLGDGIACPHARLEGDGELICAIGWIPEGVKYTADSEDKAHLLLLYCVPNNQSNAYLHEISGLSRLIKENPRLADLTNITGLDTLRLRLLEWAGTAVESSEQDTPVSEADRLDRLIRLLLPEIAAMLDDGHWSDVRDFLAGQPPPEIAELLAQAHDKYRVLLFRLLPRRLADEVFALLELTDQNQLLDNMAHEEIRQIITSLSPDDRTALFEELPANVTKRLLDMLSDHERKHALTLLSYPENSVGRLMTNRYVSVRAEWTVAEAMAHIRKTGTDSETMVVVYVTDEQGVLQDDLLVRKLILADPQSKISDLLDGHFPALRSLQDREDAVHVFKKYDLYALPVIDANGIMLGIVTSDDILDVAEEEATEDFHKGMAVTPIDMSYIDAPLSLIYRRRISWLIVLVFVNIFSGAGIAFFKNLISSTVALVFFLPLLIGSGGNAGAQAATLVIRSMALGEITMADYFKTAWRELLIAIGLGVSMAAAVFLLAWWRAGAQIGMVVAISMIAIVLFSSIIGMSLPFIFRKLGRDPAAASAPLLTSLADILGILIYFSIASVWFSAIAN
ncbi:MAG: magnesium transporter [Kiritimatiellia bacterium]